MRNQTLLSQSGIKIVASRNMSRSFMAQKPRVEVVVRGKWSTRVRHEERGGPDKL